MGGAKIWAAVAACLAAAGCSSSSAGGPCAAPAGRYVLAVSSTGQSEDDTQSCAAGAALSISVAFDDGGVAIEGLDGAAVGGQGCRLCSSAGCQIEIACGQGSPCSSGPAADASASEVQYATFVLPQQADASTGNALVEVGPGYCAFEGSASAVR